MNARPARTYRDRGIVLRGRRLGEGDRILTIYTPGNGKLDAVLKGGPRRQARAALLEPGGEADLELHRGRTLDVVTDARFVAAHWQGSLAPERFGVMTAALEAIDAFNEPRDPQPEVYALLRGALQAIARETAPEALLPRFEMRLLALLGFAGAFAACVRCDRPLDGAETALSPEDGGLLCLACDAGGRLRLSSRESENLAALSRPRGGDLPAATYAVGRVAGAVRALADAHLGRRTRSAGVMRALLELPAAASDIEGDAAPPPL